MKSHWWKILAISILVYTLVGGLLMDVPRLNILNETIRNQYFHVCMWFGMILLFIGSLVNAIKYLSSNSLKHDIRSEAYASIGILFGILGIVTGMLWARYTWGDYWSGDPKQNGAAISILIYAAYFVLRSSFEDEIQRARISSVYNIFAFFAMIPLLFILPRMTDSLHPGSGGNPGFNFYDLDSKLRMVFYPAVIGWTLYGVWIASIKIRFEEYKLRKENK
ncbi:cytochrome c biogenesis protein CcsA [Reichenbachiella versicolor]|uniref:cytochrome c biogenesis protein CcsA n=1 Tax=Reichenbachiella versicolor TaxID=1821036 RepID=UPI000D6E181D|nr:cytochrome c biogenesis protein CcsA [Reichenbachiella versicolor]